MKKTRLLGNFLAWITCDHWQNFRRTVFSSSLSLSRARAKSTIRRTQKTNALSSSTELWYPRRKILLLGAEKFCLLCPPTLLRASNAHAIGEKHIFVARVGLFCVEKNLRTSFLVTEKYLSLVINAHFPGFAENIVFWAGFENVATLHHLNRKDRKAREKEKCM